MSDDPTRANVKEAFLILNRDFQQLSQRVSEWITDHDRRLTRGGERFARIDLNEQRIDSDLASLHTNYLRTKADAERLEARVGELDRQLGATLRLANKVQQEGAALQGELRQDTATIQGDIAAIRAGLARLTTIVYGVGAAIGAIELARFVLMRRKSNA